MPIGLNYTYHHFDDGAKLIKSYVYLLDNVEEIRIYDQEHIAKHIRDEKLLNMLKDQNNDRSFEDKLIRKILLEAYPYEMQMKFLGNMINDDRERNQRLIKYFSTFFGEDYGKVLSAYIKNPQSQDRIHSFHAAHEKRFEDVSQASTIFFDFTKKLLLSQGYTDEVSALEKYVSKHLTIVYTPGISGNTDPKGNGIFVELGNSTYTTLFHELVHVVNRFFRDIYYPEEVVCTDHLTKTNEGLANFVAYHFMDQIIKGDIDAIESVDLEPKFFSMYIDIYATLFQKGSNDRKHNYDIVHQELKRFEGDLLTDQKAQFYYERFYKFFHYDQHEYFYPKEMMYYLGYEEMLELFKKSTNKKQLLANCLLGKVCL